MFLKQIKVLAFLMSSGRELHNFGATKKKLYTGSFQFKHFEDRVVNVTLILNFVATVDKFQLKASGSLQNGHVQSYTL